MPRINLLPYKTPWLQGDNLAFISERWYRFFRELVKAFNDTNATHFSLSTTLVAGAASIVFATPFADAAAYRIGLSWNEEVDIWWENKTGAGFDLLCSDAGSVADVDIIIDSKPETELL
jgi:hypothetical protein